MRGEGDREDSEEKCRVTRDVEGQGALDEIQHRHANSSPTVRLDEHRPATPETLRAAGTMFRGPVRPAIIPSFRHRPRKSVLALTFELGKRLLVAVLRSLLAVMLRHGVGRIETEPLFVISLGGHLVGRLRFRYYRNQPAIRRTNEFSPFIECLRVSLLSVSFFLPSFLTPRCFFRFPYRRDSRVSREKQKPAPLARSFVGSSVSSLTRSLVRSFVLSSAKALDRFERETIYHSDVDSTNVEGSVYARTRVHVYGT